jgi:hypothetical protein
MLSAQPFYSRDPGAISVSKRHQTRIDWQPVEQDRARPALALPAAFLGAGQMTFLTQHVEQPPQRMRQHVGPFSVQREAHAAMTFSGVAGISRTSTPACRIALTTAGAGPSIGISPTPFAPNGPRG